MGITYISTSSASGSSDTLTVNKPTGTQDNDFMIAAVISDSNVSSVPPGWTLIDTATPAYRFNTYSKVASSEGTSYQWGFVASGTNGIYITSYRQAKVSTGAIYAHKMDQIEGTNDTINAGTWSVGDTGKFIIAIGMQGGTAGVTNTKTNTPISGWTEDFDTPSGSTSCQFSSLVWNSSGAFNSCSTTMSTSRAASFKMMQMIALNPPIIYTLSTETTNFSLTGYDVTIKKICRMITESVTFTLNLFSASFKKILHGAVFTNTSKNNSSMSNTSKNSATFTNETKNISNITNLNKS